VDEQYEYRQLTGRPSPTFPTFRQLSQAPGTTGTKLVLTWISWIARQLSLLHLDIVPVPFRRHANMPTRRRANTGRGQTAECAAHGVIYSERRVRGP
jgi:hypothetical protein